METQNVADQYDYIIAGAGASGLSLVWQMLNSRLSRKKILIVDADLKPTHDKTWCFWYTGAPPFRDIIYNKWDNAEVSTFANLFEQPLYSHSYYCIRSIDFQKKILSAVKDYANIDILETPIEQLSGSDSRAVLHAEGKKISAQYIFQSCFEPIEIQHSDIQYPLIQHFLGWEIVTPSPVFEERTFTLMDFDETFDEGIAFMYLLPWTKKSGLIEYTVFSETLLSRQEYEDKIAVYLNNRFNLKSIDYTIQRKEAGKIPMQDRPYIPWYGQRILNIGTQGGMTKPSTGYTFSRIQQQAKVIVNQLISNNPIEDTNPSTLRFKAYDLWLLHIIATHPRKALEIFYNLFENNTMDEVFRFLSEKTTLKEELKIMSNVPYKPFLRALWKTKKRLLTLGRLF